MIAAARLAFRALIGQDARVQTSRAAHVDALGQLAEVLRRLGHRARGEPVLIRRLRLVVPDDRLDPWGVELELVDEADPGRWCSAADVWAGNPLAVEVANGPQYLPQLETTLRELAAVIAARVDVLANLGAESRPTAIELDVEAADEFLEQAPVELERLGIELIGPEHLVRANVAVRGRAAPAPPSDRSAGFNRETIVQWTFAAAADDEVVGDLGGRARPRRTSRSVAAVRRPPLGPHRSRCGAQGPGPTRLLRASARRRRR